MNKKLFVPLVTPMNNWVFDRESLKTLVKTIDHVVDGYVPCLSSWEGHKMSVELRKTVLTTLSENTKKPVFVGIKRKTKQEVYEMLDAAKTLWAHWVTTPVLCNSENDIEAYVTDIARHSQLPMIIYNTETANISDIDLLKRLDMLWNIAWIKDSSGNKEFFQQMLEEKKAWNLTMDVLQWMENELHTSLESDGFLIALANIEAELCREYLDTWDQKLWEKIKGMRSKYNLWGNRYITLKTILMMRWTIASAEEIDALPY
jgi:4-hydroxy-tetrahydrodipicolinate synthase